MPVTTPLGRVLRDRDGCRLQFERSLPVGVEAVWRAVTDPVRCAQWFGTWTGDPDSGWVTLTLGEPGAPPEPLQVLQCTPPHRLEIVLHPPGQPAWLLRLTLQGQGQDTALTFTHVLAKPYDASTIGPGWHYYLDRLAAVIRGAPVDQQWEDYVALGSRYPCP